MNPTPETAQPVISDEARKCAEAVWSIVDMDLDDFVAVKSPTIQRHMLAYAKAYHEKESKESVLKLRDASMFIESFYIDWARLQEGPDHDPDYKPEFPEIINEISQVIDATKGQL